MKNLKFLIFIIMILSCVEKKNNDIDKHHIFNNIDLTKYNGKRVFYLLDIIGRLDYKYASPIEYYKDGKAHIGGFKLIYSDSISIEIVYDSLSFIPYISRSSEFYERDSSWTPDNLLKEKIQYVYISGKKNGHEITVSSYNKRIRKE